MTSLLGAMFPLPRVLYAMSSDGLLYSIFKRVNKRTQTPLYATLLSGLLAAILALVLNLQQLIEMMSLGTLMVFAIFILSSLLSTLCSVGMVSNRNFHFLLFFRLNL